MSYQTLRLLFKTVAFVWLLIAANNTQAALSDMSRIFHQVPGLNDFEICFGGGCAEVKHVSLTADEWQKVTLIFANAHENAAQERQKIADAIGLLETLVGTKIGTSSDIAGTFYNGNLTGQLDCNDEAINSTTYMRLMRQAGLIKWHDIDDTRTRNFFFTGWPHSTAAIHDVKTGEQFAVDSWFYNNGAPATIVPFSVWKSGYRPADTPIDQPQTSKVNTPVR